MAMLLEVLPPEDRVLIAQLREMLGKAAEHVSPDRKKGMPPRDISRSISSDKCPPPQKKTTFNTQYENN